MTNILVEEILGVHRSFLGGAINLVDLNFLWGGLPLGIIALRLISMVYQQWISSRGKSFGL
jgi:hypothetical protein